MTDPVLQSTSYSANTDKPESAPATWRARWQALRSRHRHWLINIAIGLLIETVLHFGGHTFHWETLANAQNWALDRMMRVNAVVDPVVNDGSRLPQQTLVSIDDTTWRSPTWGGGEPYRAPRDRLLTMVDSAFAMGAKQVVLDILVEGEGGRAAEDKEDKAFAEGLEKLLNKENGIGPGRQLVLVRSIRDPLRSSEHDHELLSRQGKLVFPDGLLSEIRRSPYIDRVVDASKGRIVVAAPYFSYSTDRVLRDWQIFRVVCERDGDVGVTRLVPSVQMVVIQKHFGLDANLTQTIPPERCTPLPQPPFAAPMSVAELEKRSKDLDEQVKRITKQYWTALRGSIANSHDAYVNKLKIGPTPPGSNDLGNRVIYRTGAVPPPGDRFFSVVSADDLLDPGTHRNITGAIRDRIVVIGQTFAEAGDRHYTPMGEMPGSMVLLNAIDSMARYQMIRAPSAWVTIPIALVLIVIVGYIFARWDSFVGTVISTVVLLASLAVASFYVFRYGVWLDFALPLIGIQIHQMVASFEERIRLREVARLQVASH